MSANAGPDIIEDGIVFYYDTGNAVKSYIGEPTTNLALDTLQQGGWPGTNTLISSGTKTFDLTTSTAEWGGDASWTMFYYDVTAYTGQHICLSATYEYSSSPGGGNLAFVMIGQTTGSQTYLGYSSPLDYNAFTPTSGQQISWNGVIGDGGKIGILTWMNNGSSTTLTSRFSKIQLEVKTHPTQFVNGTRSATQGLLDMTRNGTINLTDASFTPNAQLTFDGTNDTVYSPSNSSNNIAGDITMELILNRTNGYNAAVMHKEVQYTLYISGNGDITYADSSLWSYGTFGFYYSGITAGSYHHVVATKSGSLVTIYVNSNVVISKTFGSAITQTNNNLYIGSYAGSSNYFAGQIPISKVYNRALTASEVLTNYNAFKSRFGI